MVNIVIENTTETCKITLKMTDLHNEKYNTCFSDNLTNIQMAECQNFPKIVPYRIYINKKILSLSSAITLQCKQSAARCLSHIFIIRIINIYTRQQAGISIKS